MKAEAHLPAKVVKLLQMGGAGQFKILSLETCRVALFFIKVRYEIASAVQAQLESRRRLTHAAAV